MRGEREGGVGTRLFAGHLVFGVALAFSLALSACAVDRAGPESQVQPQPQIEPRAMAGAAPLIPVDVTRANRRPAATARFGLEEVVGLAA